MRELQRSPHPCDCVPAPWVWAVLHPVAPQDFQQQMDHLAQRWQQLGQREEQLRDDTIKFNTFLKV